MHLLDFERPLAELEEKIATLRAFQASNEEVEVRAEVRKLMKRLRRLQRDTFAKLSGWQRTQVARHPNRPYVLDIIGGLCADFIELHGDRAFRDDPSIVGGIGHLDGIPVLIVGQQKGRDTKEKLYRNFGMAHPEGYRKALRLMRLAEKFRKPILTLLDTPGAYPGIGAEERGQSTAIAESLMGMASLGVPIVCCVIGEGGSGGALALGVGNRVLMLSNAIYSVISPEGCAAILWNDGSQAPKAAEALKLTASDLLELGVIDEIIKEPPGGAHRDPQRTISVLRRAVRRHLHELLALPPEKLIEQRYERFRRIGQFSER
ncbi:MAG: acetyl-CoA carboxylase carboxyltransferase subunit alpha [Candidatus Tectomicrobia bacterium]|nr:acetyl-CoA carboxylase carboxyltransferase subunit alpha [Candidatus Tectomicrobia bacterium]